MLGLFLQVYGWRNFTEILHAAGIVGFKSLHRQGKRRFWRQCKPPVPVTPSVQKRLADPTLLQWALANLKGVSRTSLDTPCELYVANNMALYVVEEQVQRHARLAMDTFNHLSRVPYYGSHIGVMEYPPVPADMRPVPPEPIYCRVFDCGVGPDEPDRQRMT